MTTKLVGVELRRVLLPLVAPFRTSLGSERDRDILLVRAVTTAGEGWGECVATVEPRYSAEYVDGAAEVLRRYLGAVTNRVAAGVSVGIMDSVGALLDSVAGYLDQGYLRIKLKIEPGWDIE